MDFKIIDFSDQALDQLSKCTPISVTHSVAMKFIILTSTNMKS